ncbi:MAG: hypothetical protein J6L86_00210 [Alphaproteobacteria bacterium]|nr:hypothetical protein [Alphaproteobacteria bacterium]MBQ8631390.1 hypothetical protein [Alphaproteobacteria bacterium]
MKKEYLIIGLVIFVAALIFVPWLIKLLVLVIVAAAAVIYFGKEKTLETLQEFFSTVFNMGKEHVEKVAPKGTEQELKIHDVEVNKLDDGSYLLSIFTEIGKITLAPRRFDTVPEVLQKGKTVKYRIINTVEKCKLVKEKSILAQGADGEERIFRVMD